MRSPRRSRPHGTGRPLPKSAAAASALLLFAAACSGGGGDPPSTPIADPCGGGTRLPDVVGAATWLSNNKDEPSCKYPADRRAQLSGIRVIAIDRFDETSEGATGNYYVQDACQDPAPFTGMTIYAPGFSPPNLRLAPGDVTDFLGSLTEFEGPAGSEFPFCRTLPELSGSMSFRFEEGPTIPAITIPVTDLKSYTTARPWLGMLVKVENLKASDKPYESSGRYTIPIDVGGGINAADIPNVSNELFDLKAWITEQQINVDQGLVFKSVTGVVTYFYGFKIAPRSADDLEL